MYDCLILTAVDGVSTNDPGEAFCWNLQKVEEEKVDQGNGKDGIKT